MAEESSGPATDRDNDPVIDPTENVRALVHSETRRQDDLRLSTQKRIEDQLDCIREVATLRAMHSHELRGAEAARINAIRAVDVSAVQQASTDAEVRATALAAQVALSAETLRNQVTSTAEAQARNLSQALDPIQKRIDDLTRVQYEGVGQKTQVVEERASGANIGLWIGIGVSVFALLLTLVGLIVVVLSASP